MDEFPLPLGMTSFANTTEGSTDDLDTCFEPDTAYDGGDRVYAFTLEDAGSVRITLTDGPGLDGNLVIRRDACDSDAGETCLSQEFIGTRKSFASHLEAGTYYVIVDSVGTEEGEYELVVSYTLPDCGDGLINPGEECDVGVGVAGDGCGDPSAPNECEYEEPPANADLCPGETIAVPEGTTMLAASEGYSTIGFTNDYNGTCQLLPGGPDRVFAITPGATGILTATIGFDETGMTLACDIDPNGASCWDQLLYARAACAGTDDPLTELACADETGPEGETITFSVVQGVPVYLFVDGYNGDFYSQGPFNLFLDLVAQ